MRVPRKQKKEEQKRNSVLAAKEVEAKGTAAPAAKAPKKATK